MTQITGLFMWTLNEVWAQKTSAVDDRQARQPLNLAIVAKVRLREI